MESALLDSPRTKAQFILPKSSFGDRDPIHPACASRTQDIPRLARAKNTRGKWKYLIQQRGEEVQHFQVTFCTNAGSKCINDEDRPPVEGMTTCKQAYKMQKMLAVDESGQVTVDSFSLPSACLCHFVTLPPIGVRSSLAGSVRDIMANEEPIVPNCDLESKPIASAKLKKSKVVGTDSATLYAVVCSVAYIDNIFSAGSSSRLQRHHIRWPQEEVAHQTPAEEQPAWNARSQAESGAIQRGRVPERQVQIEGQTQAVRGGAGLSEWSGALRRG